MPQKMPFYFILLANKKHKNNSIKLSVYHISIMEMSGLMTQSVSVESVFHSIKISFIAQHKNIQLIIVSLSVMEKYKKKLLKWI